MVFGFDLFFSSSFLFSSFLFASFLFASSSSFFLLSLSVMLSFPPRRGSDTMLHTPAQPDRVDRP